MGDYAGIHAGAVVSIQCPPGPIGCLAEALMVRLLFFPAQVEVAEPFKPLRAAADKGEHLHLFAVFYHGFARDGQADEVVLPGCRALIVINGPDILKAQHFQRLCRLIFCINGC